VQAFSYLQRNISDKKYIKLAPLAALVLAYEAVSTLNPYLPPLFGVMLTLVYFVQRREFAVFALGFLLIFEADRGYYLFSSWLFMYIYVYYLLPFVSKFLDCRHCIAVLSAFFAYPLYLFFLGMVDAFLLRPGVVISITPLLVYMLFETLIALSLE
jgi:hypothetical protein